MEEYKIDENTTYMDEYSGNTDVKAIKYAKKDGSNLVVEFREADRFYLGDGYTSNGSTYSCVKASAYIQKPVKVEEKRAEDKKTEEKKLSKFEKAKNKLLQKLLLNKVEDKKEPENETPKESFSKEVLFTEEFMNPDKNVKGFLANPIKLDSEYKEIANVLETARKTIITDGYRLKKEAENLKHTEHMATQAKIKEKESLKRRDLDKGVAAKIKGYTR